MSHLRFNYNNEILTCGCGAVSVMTRDWNTMAEWRRDQIERAARSCATCRTDQFHFRVWLMADGICRWQVYVPADRTGLSPVPAEDTLVSVAPHRYQQMIRRAGPGWWHDKHRAWEPMHRHLHTAKGEPRGTLYAEPTNGTVRHKPTSF